ncbi:MAG: ABC transporter permease [Chthoniobacterales bacterium]
MITIWKIAWQQGLGEIFTHWFRTLLTMIGIVMSVSALVGMVALNEGVARGKREASLQSGSLTKIIIRTSNSRSSSSVAGLFSRGLVREDARALLLALPSLEWVSATVKYDREKVTIGNRLTTPRVLAGTPILQVQDRYLPPVAGRFITALDVDESARVCVLGGTAAKELFDRPETQAVGKKVLIRGVSFLIVGVLPEHLSESAKRKLASGVIEAQDQRRKLLRSMARRNWFDPFSWKNNLVIIPLTTAQATFNSTNVGADGVDGGPLLNVSEIQAGFSSSSQKEPITKEARAVLLNAHNGVEDFEIQPPDASMDDVEKEIRSNRITGSVIAGISLLVGGLGIVNIMLASIADRTREIGVRRALGASAGDIFRQVLVESILIALLGGVLGIGGSMLLLKTLEAVSPPDNAPVLSWGIVIFGVCSAGVIGIVAGLYPALKASALSPTEALTSE